MMVSKNIKVIGYGNKTGGIKKKKKDVCMDIDCTSPENVNFFRRFLHLTGNVFTLIA